MGTEFYLLSEARREILDIGKAYPLAFPYAAPGVTVSPLLPRDEQGDIELDGADLTAAHIRAATDLAAERWGRGWLAHLDKILAWVGEDTVTLVSEHDERPWSGRGWRRRSIYGGHVHCGHCRALDIGCTCGDPDYIGDSPGDECPGEDCPGRRCPPGWDPPDALLLNIQATAEGALTDTLNGRVVEWYPDGAPKRIVLDAVADETDYVNLQITTTKR